MKCKVENGRLIINSNDQEYSFEAHADEPRPSLMGLGISAGGQHWSSRDPNVKLEKHTSIQDIALGENYAAWYTQEFVPNGVDYKLTKKACIYIGNLSTGQERLAYKGECYGDLCFDGNDLYFNMGNKAAVITEGSDEAEILFKHSGIKKNGIDMRITPRRIFFTHWTKDNNHLMWYDRNTKEVINPHVDSAFYHIIDEENVIFRGLYHSWIINTETLKKKRCLTNKVLAQILNNILKFLDIPEKYADNYLKELRVVFDYADNGRLFYNCETKYRSDSDFETQHNEAYEANIPHYIDLIVSSDPSCKDIRIEVNNLDIVRIEKKSLSTLKYPNIIVRAQKKSQ